MSDFLESCEPVLVKVSASKSTNDESFTKVTPIKHEILSTKEKKQLCKPLRSIKRKIMTFTLPYSKALGNVKSLDFINELKLATDTPTTVIHKAVVVQEMIGGIPYVKMVVFLKSPDTFPIGRFLWKVYKTAFPSYHYEIHADILDNSEYLEKARALVSPRKPRKMDMEPFVYGETLYYLLMQMENAEKGVERFREIDNNWRMFPMKLQQAVLESNKNWLYYISSKPYKILGERHPYTCRLGFDEISSMMQLPAKEGVVEDPLTIRRRESKERYIQRIWDDLYDPVMRKKRKFGNMNRILGEKEPL